MKKALVFSILTFITFSQSALIATNSATAQTTKIMVCRGGGNIDSTYRLGKNVNQLTINFTKAKTSSSQKPPSSGECAWEKRAIGALEPSQLAWEPKKYDSNTSYLLKSLRSNNLFYVHCYKVNGNYFKIQKVGQ